MSAARLAVLVALLAASAGCARSERPAAPPPAARPATSLTGMTVEQLGGHLRKELGLGDVALVAAMGEHAFEIYGPAGERPGARLVVSWTANDQGLPVVDRFAFTEARLPALDDEAAVIGFCQKLLYGGGTK